MTITSWRCCICTAALGLCAAQASAQVLFSDDFNVNSSASWKVNSAPTANAANQSATFAFDYSAFGIPSAPGSSDTLGLRLRANIPGTPDNPVTTRPAGATSGLSVSPLNKNFGTNYQMEFYAWSNYFGLNGNLGDNVNSQGGTNNVLFAVGTSGTAPLVVGNTALVTNGAMDGVAFATTGDGGIASDYRAYPASGTILAATSGAYAAGNDATSVQSTNAFYTTMFPAIAAPAVQEGLATAEFTDTNLNPMLGTTQAGSFGFAWQKVKIVKNNNVVTWSINDALIATVNSAALTLGGANVALGVSDVNSTTARYPSLVFTVFDNLVVTALPSSGPQGDFNADGKVDGADFLKWQRGESPNPLSATDLDAWKAGYGAASAVGVAAAVPEPAAIGIGLLGAAMFVIGARRR